MKRSGLETARRVAELRETGARGAAAAALRAQQEARARAEASRSQLEGASLPAGPAGQLVAAAEARARLAAESAEAGRGLAESSARLRDALGAWTAASRRAGVLAESCERRAAEREAATELVVQRTLDDLAARGRHR